MGTENESPDSVQTWRLVRGFLSRVADLGHAVLNLNESDIQPDGNPQPNRSELLCDKA